MPNLSLPTNPRYQPKELIPFFGYDNLYLGPIMVEVANLQVLGGLRVIPEADFALLTSDVIGDLQAITTTEVDEVERKVTKHDVRALVSCMRKRMPERLGKWLHIPLTSYDVLDTGRILHYREAFYKCTAPSVEKVIEIMAGLIEMYADQPMLGRTHGQAALPITVGFWLSTVLSRVMFNYQKMRACVDDLVGKISGAVGAHNAQFGLGFLERCGDLSYEDRVLAKLGLKASRISTQILPPEPLAYFLHTHVLLAGSIAQLARDCRHLMRTEIAEIGEPFEEGQAGSSTMAHKRNPINWETIEGAFKKILAEFVKVHLALISEHQRDLTDSSVMRDFPAIVIDLQIMLNTLLREKDGVSFLARMRVNEAACQANLDRSSGLVIAEPLYIILQMLGYEGDTYDLVNKQLMPIAQANGNDLMQALEIAAEEDEDLASIVRQIPSAVRNLLDNPSEYTGLAQAKALQIAAEARELLAECAAR